MATIGFRPIFSALRDHELGLRHRPFGGVDQDDRAVHHGQDALHLAAEIGVARRIDDVDAGVLPDDRGRLGEDGDAALLLEIVRIHGALGDALVFAEGAGLLDRSWSTRVVLPWSTWAMMAILRSFMGGFQGFQMQNGPVRGGSAPAPLARTGRKSVATQYSDETAAAIGQSATARYFGVSRPPEPFRGMRNEPESGYRNVGRRLYELQETAYKPRQKTLYYYVGIVGALMSVTKIGTEADETIVVQGNKILGGIFNGLGGIDTLQLMGDTTGPYALTFDFRTAQTFDNFEIIKGTATTDYIKLTSAQFAKVGTFDSGTTSYTDFVQVEGAVVDLRNKSFVGTVKVSLLTAAAEAIADSKATIELIRPSSGQQLRVEGITLTDGERRQYHGRGFDKITDASGISSFDEAPTLTGIGGDKVLATSQQTVHQMSEPMRFLATDMASTTSMSRPVTYSIPGAASISTRRAPSRSALVFTRTSSSTM